MPALVIALLLLFSSEVIAQEEEPQDAITLRYIGKQYLRIVVLDKTEQEIINRKLVSGQSFSLPELNNQGKAYKQFTVTVGKRNMVFKLACKSKQRKKRFGSDAFIINYAPRLAKKPPCFIKDEGAVVNLSPSA